VRPSGEGLLARRSAVARLGGALRRLTDAAVRTTVEVPVLERVAAAAADLEAALRARQRAVTDVPAVDDLGGTVRMYNPTFGAGNPGAPPLALHPQADGSMLGTCTLGPAFEGPHTFAHGGVSAMLLDEVLGRSATPHAHPGVTAALEVSYRAPVPLGTPLHLRARVTSVEGRKVRAEGALTTADDESTVLVEARGLFIRLRPGQAEQLAPSAPHPGPSRD
jgi:acyl-coenzyme A thioesterase PaaI-like protein